MSNEFVTEVVKVGNTKYLDHKPSKTWEITINNYSDRDIEWLKSLEVNKITVSKEIGENKTPHLQGKITFKRAYRLTGLKKLHNKAHWEVSKCVDDANYCRKIDGEIVLDICNRSQGERTDLIEIKNQIIKGKKVEELVMEEPMVYHQYGRTLEKIEDICNRSKIRTEMTEGIWYYGKTGTGKSHRAFEGFNEKTHYLWTNDNGWWDGYNGQEIVVMNDFRGEIPYNTLLQLIDKWPMKVRRRNKEPVNFTSKKVIITSSVSPDKIYKNRDREDDLNQLLRRIKLVNTSEDDDSMMELDL